MSCVNRSSREFKSLAANNNVDTNTLELIIHKYWLETGSEEKYPTDVYIQAQLGNGEYQENIPQVRQLWQKEYSHPKEYPSLQEVQKAVQEAQKFFPKSAIVYYKNAKGQYVLSVKRPVVSLNRNPVDFFSNDPSKRMDLGLKTNEEYSIDKVEELFNRFNTDRTSKHFADKLFQLARQIGLKVYFSDDMGMIGGMEGHGTVTYNRLYLEGTVQTERKPSVLLHELIHAVTMYAFNGRIVGTEDNVFTNSKQVQQFLKEINDVYDAVKFNPALQGEYGIKSVTEFVAELFNPVFAQKLQSIDAKKAKKSVWQRILDAFKSLFGLHPSSTYYQRSMNALDKALRGFDEKGGLVYNGMKSQLQQAYNDHRLAFKDMTTEELKSALKKAINDNILTLGNKSNNNNETDRLALSQRFSQEELIGSNGRLEEAEACLQRTGYSSTPEKSGETTGVKWKGKEAVLAKKQINTLESWAKRKGIWIDNTPLYLEKKYGDVYAEGGKAYVYLSPDGTKVVKEIGLDYYIEPQLLLDRIVLHNYLFPESKLTVTNFGKNDDGKFVVIAEQPFIQGEYVSQDEIKDFMESMGFEPYNKRGTEFINKDKGIIVNDLHDENVIKTPNSYIVIDADIRLNTANYGLNGTRTTEGLNGQLSSLIDSMSREDIIKQLSQIEQEYNDLDLAYGSKELTPRGKSTFTFKDGTTLDTPFTPNDQQAYALNVMDEFIKSDDLNETSMTLAGYAGTGKTSIMEILAQKAHKMGKSIWFCATTNAAAKTLQAKVNKSGDTAMTLNKAFGINVQQDPSKDEYDTRNLIDNLTKSKITPGSTVIIDEASMIGEKHYNDIINVAKMDGLKIIFVGDDAQLPPVNETKISKVFRDPNAKVVRLTKVERTDDNAILKEATDIRNGKDLSEESSFNEEGKGVAYINGKEHEKAVDDVINHYAPKLSEDLNYFRILAHTNSAVGEYNRKVRRALGYNDPTPRVGEPIMGYKSWGYKYIRKGVGEYMLLNSASYTITKVGSPTIISGNISGEKYALSAIPLTIVDAFGEEKNINYIDVVNNPENKRNALIVAREVARLWRLPAKSPRVHGEITRLSNLLWINDGLEENKHRIADKVLDFGYAMTVHKSQGATFTHVLMDEDNINTASNFNADREDVDWNNVVPAFDAQDYTDATKTDNAERVGEGETIDLGLGLTSIPVQTEQKTSNKPAQTSSDIANVRRSLKYVAMSRATDTVTVVSSHAKKEDSPLNHIKGKENTEKKQTLPLEHKELLRSAASQSATSATTAPTTFTPQGTTISYQMEGRDYRSVYTIQGSHIFNTKGEEVFKEGSKDRRAIFANLAVKQKRAVVIEHEGKKYIVNDRDQIISVASKNTISPKWDKTPAILDKAHKAFEDIKQQSSSQKQIDHDIVQQEIEHLNSMGIKVQLVNGQEEMIRQLQNERGTIQESRPIINYNNSKKATKAERKEILNIVKSKKYNIPGTDAVIIKDNPNAIYLIDHSADEQLYDNLKKGGDGFGIRKVYKVSRLNDDSIREIIRNIAQGHNYTERSLHNKLLSLGITQEHLSGIDLNAELKMVSSDNAGILSAGKGQEREIGYNQSGTNGRESQKGAGLEEGKQSSSIDTFTTPDGTVYGYATKDGRMVLDRSAIKPEHPLHEYTHLWDNVVAQKNPELWKRGVELMKQLDNGKMWKQFAEDENYGKKWAKMNLTQEQFDNMVASEVHARLVGENGAKLLDSIAKQKGQKGIIAKLKAWILEAWQNLKATFSNWSEDDIKKLTLKDFNHMTVRDFADAVDFNALKESESSNSNLDSFNNLTNQEKIDKVYNEVIKNEAPNSPTSKLAKTVFDTVKKLDINYTFVDNIDGDPSVTGKYIAREHTIKVNKNNMLPNTLLHETIHAVTLYYMSTINRSKLPKNIQIAISEIEECYRLLKDYYIKQNYTRENGSINEYAANMFFSMDAGQEGLYGLSSPKELVAEISRPELLKFIRDYDNKHKGKNIFQRLVDSVLKFFGVNKQYTSVEKTLKEAMVTLITNPDAELYRKYENENKNLKDNITKLRTAANYILFTPNNNNKEFLEKAEKEADESNTVEDYGYLDTTIDVKNEYVSFRQNYDDKAPNEKLPIGSLIVQGNNGSLGVCVTRGRATRKSDGTISIPLRMLFPKWLAEHQLNLKTSNKGNLYIDLQEYESTINNGENRSNNVEIYHGNWSRGDVEKQTDKVFLFGDNTNDRLNTHHVPTMTQAVIRGLPNAIGIDTKKDRGTSANSYFTDADFDTFKKQVDEAIQKAIDSGKTIVIPEGGIGTGKAMLDKKAPKLYKYLQEQLNKLKNGTYQNETTNSIESQSKETNEELQVSLPGYEHFNDLYENTKVDAAWKIPLLRELDSQLSNDNTPEQNQELIEQMDNILRATTEEDLQRSPKEQKQLKETNKQLDEYDKLNTQLDNLLAGEFADHDKETGNLSKFGIKFSATEIRQVAEFIGNDLSDIITKVQTEEGYAERTFQGISLPKNADYGAMSRLEVVSAIGLSNIIEQAKKDFDPQTFEYKDITFDLKATLAMENWDILMMLASDTFALNEGFGIKRNYAKGGFEVTQSNNQIDVDDFNEYHDEEIEEEEGDGQEHYQVDQRTVDTMWSMSALVRQAIHNCFMLDKNGNKITNKGWQKPERIQTRKAVNSILNWCKGSINIHDMVDRLSAQQNKHPWVSQLIGRLSDTSGKEADFQSQFFGVFCKAFQPYNIIMLKNGRYVSVPVNDHPVRKQIYDSIVAQYKIGTHPLFTTDGKVKADVLGEAGSKSDVFTLHKALDFIYPISRDAQRHLQGSYNYQNFSITPEQMEEIAANLAGVYKLLGFYNTEEAVREVLDESTLVEVADALRYIVDGLEKGLKNQRGGKEYKPFAYGESGNIEHATKKILTPMTDILEETAINAFYDSGKMYQSYVIPSFLTKWSNKIKSLEGKEFNNFLMSEYGDSEWFRDPKTGKWRNPMLAQLAWKGGSKFDFKVELNFNKHNYMRNMSDSEYALSLVTEYFSEKAGIKGRDDFAYFRIPMESNKPSSEFFRWYAYKDMDRYKDQVTNDLFMFYLQEVSRIQTVRRRNKKKGDEGFIKNFDTHGRKFNFLPFLNSYLENDAASKGQRTWLRNTDNTVSENNDRMAELLQRHIDGLEENQLSAEELATLEQMVKTSIKNYMQDRADRILDDWDRSGITEAARQVTNIVIDDVFLNEKEKDPVKRNEYVRKSLENFIWNDFLASNNILELTVGDIAFYDSAEDLQKRLSELHAPGIRANVFATDYEGNRVSDGKYRTGLLKDFDKYKSNIIANISEVCDRIIARAPESQKPALRTWKESLVGENGHYTKINVADAQGLSSPSSYRKKAFLFGKWSRHAEKIYQKLLKGEYNYDDLQTAFQTLKPFVYTHLTKNLGVADAPIHTMHIPFQAKNSEYLLIMADAMIQGEVSKSGELGRPNLLRALYDIMEDSAYDGRERDASGKVTKVGTYNGRGIDTFQFESAIKSGLQGALDLGQFIDMQGGRAAAYEYLKGKLYNADGTYNTDNYVHEASFEDYCIQQEVPDHFKSHKQSEGSQTRMIIPSDLDYYKNPTLPDNERDAEDNIVYYEWNEPDGTRKKLNAKEFRKEYEETIGENIEDSLNMLSQELHLDSDNKVERNIALSNILQREIMSSPRYGLDLMQTCQVDKTTGEFRIPKGDPIQAKRIEQLINSIIKNRVNKQEITGGPVVQVTNFGTSRQLHIRFNDRQGGLLKTEEEFLKDDKLVSQYKTYKNYTKDNQAGIAYFEVFAPIWDDKLVSNFADENGNIDIDALENADPELLRMVSYRIPTEDKYSMAPMKVVGFLPREAGAAIMLPYELTEIDDSDFDVDKRYIMRKDYTIVPKSKGQIARAMCDFLFDEFKRQHKGEISQEQRTALRDYVNTFIDNPDKRVSDNSTIRLMGRLYREKYLIRHLKNIYRRVAWTTEKPQKGTRQYRDNKIVDMSLAVLTNEFTADKILNPGGFDNFKHMGYMIEAFRKHPEMSWNSLQKMSVDELKALSDTGKHLGWVDTEIQFYNQNSATTSMIGIYAVNKIAHAVLESNGIQINVKNICGSPFTIDGHQFGYGDGLMEVDPRYDMEGNLIGKTLGSGVSASADGVKAPVQNLMNIGTATAGTFNTMLRLGLPFEDASLLISQDVITRLLKDFNRQNLSNYASLNQILQDHIDRIKRDGGITDNAAINGELTKEQMIEGLKPTEHPATDYKVLNVFQKFMALDENMRKITFVTRFNSISSAVGPLIIDNLILEHKMQEFTDTGETPTNFYDRHGNSIDIADLLDYHSDGSPKNPELIHPILAQFARTVDVARQLFSDMPAGSEGFRQVLRMMPQGLNSKIYNDKQLLSKLSDFYQSYLLLQSGLVKEDDLKYYVNEFPKWFDKQDFKAKYPDNPFIQAINLKVSQKTNRPFLEIKITGMDQTDKDVLSSGWIDLHKENPELSTKLFIYNFFRAGIGFSPKTFMALAPSYVKEHLEGKNDRGEKVTYVDTYRNFPSVDPEIVFDQFVRNNWDNGNLVPWKMPITKGGFSYDYSKGGGKGELRIGGKLDIPKIKDCPYIKTQRGVKTYLWKQVSAEKDLLIYQEVAPLGDNNEYLEMYLENRNKGLSDTTTLTDDNAPDSPSNNGTDIQAPKSADMPTEGAVDTSKQEGYQMAELADLIAKQAYKGSEGRIKMNSQEAIGKIADIRNNVSQYKGFLKNVFKQKGLNLNEDEAMKEFKKYC